ncbi:MAG: VCBS repeat-containing protein, partial [Myxococcales bacterium]|nr:VCBS repeat-containing protein [Myxococcales bacterium]
ADLDGDGVVDFVVLGEGEAPEADPLVGRAYWRVHRGGGSGFAEAGDRWAIPYDLRRHMASSFATARHGLLDLDADGRLDFVAWQSGEAPEADPLLGSAYWSVYRNTGDGFAAASERWGLPFDLGDESGPGGLRHAVVGLDGPCPRLVVLRDGLAPDREPRLGRAFWHLW